ncbi:hypothetical protein FB567DRAFT_535056 [Paraphoma chrysanthemicola]|uniref:C2H2-type domain-containing protein n=1 Tax=Paraphoma chrysanthemicola TaxID=798071 RepID=A0A8K0VVA0_9PLEO|nr:hypothetical protein FB567DRAFT_535056 [Paraphoma chrysanthemicola]
MFSTPSQQESETLNIDEVSGSEHLITTTSATTITVDNGANLTCDFDGCSSGPFKRRGELTRHKKTHGTQRMFSCTAKDCNRIGSQGFVRKDKRNDHILAGHNDETTFICSRCSLRLPRDLMGVHGYDGHGIKSYRTCPLPRCSFKVNVWGDARLDKLTVHLKEKHELKQRNNFAILLRQSGYDAQTCGVVCPICPGIGYFLKHEDFYEHFMQAHFHGTACRQMKWDKNHSATCTHDCFWRKPEYRLPTCTFIPDEVEQHRRTILRVWPDFTCHPVWDDIRNCNKQSSTSHG